MAAEIRYADTAHENGRVNISRNPTSNDKTTLMESLRVWQMPAVTAPEPYTNAIEGNNSVKVLNSTLSENMVLWAG